MDSWEGDQWTDRCYNSLFRMHARTVQTCQEKGEEFCKLNIPQLNVSLSLSILAGDTIIDGRYTHEEVWFSN